MTHRGLRELDGGEPVVVDAVGGELGIDDLHIKDAVDLDRDVVLRDALLRRDVDRLLFERVLVGDPVEQRHQHVEAGLERRRVLPQPLDDVGLLLRNDADHPHEDDGHENQQGDQDDCQRVHDLCKHKKLPFNRSLMFEV